MFAYLESNSETIVNNWKSEGIIFNYPNPFVLESGKTLSKIELCYSTYGKLNADKSNVVWVCHALTGDSNVYSWWGQLFGEQKLYNPEEHFVICVNVLGSCYGSTGPLSINPATNTPYYHDFPEISMRDIVASFELLRNHLGINRIHTCIGGSLGGQQALEWAVSNPDLIENLILMATNARTSPWGIALNETQRMAICADETWKNQNEKAGLNGLKAARAIALLSYRSYTTYNETQKDVIDALGTYKAVSYQKYQGQKFSERYNTFSYWAMTVILDSHNVGRNRISLENALSKVKSKTLILGISSDVLFPTEEQEFLAKHIPSAKLQILDSLYGHDGFLMESEKIIDVIKKI